MKKFKTNRTIKSMFARLRIHLITGRELEKIFTIPRSLIFLITTIIVPFLVADVKNYPLEIQTRFKLNKKEVQ